MALLDQENRFKIFLKVLTLSFFLVAFTIPFSIRISSLVVVFSCFIWVFSTVILKNLDLGIFKSKPFLFLGLSFAVLIAGLFHSKDLGHGIEEIERGLFIIAFPFLFYRYRNNDLTVRNLILFFIAGCLIITLYGLFYALIILSGEEQKQVFQFSHTYFTDHILIHPTYLSVYFIFIFFFFAETIRITKTFKNNFLLIRPFVGILYSISMLLFLRSQMGLLIFTILFIIYLIIVLKKRAWLVTFILFMIGFLVFLLDSHRVSTFFDTYGKNVSSALDQRISVWKGTIEGIKKAPFFGAGTGGEQQLINEGYIKTGYKEGIDNSYNAHNQYLQFLARNGMLELLCFLILLFYSFRQSLKMPDYTFLMFNMMVTLIMFTESFLNVQKGIVFFYFFVCAFIYLPYESEKEQIKE